MPRPKGSADLLEDRRKRALALLDAGHSLNEVGRRDWMQSEFGDALARCQAAWRSGSIASTFLSRPSLEAERGATKTLGAFSSSRTDRAGLPDESLDHGPHC